MLLCIFKLYAVPYSLLITLLKGNVIMYFQIICFNVIMGLESELGTLVHDQFLQNSPSKLEQLFETMIVGYTVLKLCLHVSTTSYNNFIDYIWKFQVYCIVALCYICMYIVYMFTSPRSSDAGPCCRRDVSRIFGGLREEVASTKQPSLFLTM